MDETTRMMLDTLQTAIKQLSDDIIAANRKFATKLRDLESREEQREARLVWCEQNIKMNAGAK